MVTRDELWCQLRRVALVSFEAKSEAETGWNGKGNGFVTVSEPSEGMLLFTEEGYWKPNGRNDLHFTNVFRWTKFKDALRLEHLRYGPENPIFLFDLAPGVNGEWHSQNPHHCGEDCYSGSLALAGNQILVHWQIRGPRKNESIRYVYQASKWPTE